MGRGCGGGHYRHRCNRVRHDYLFRCRHHVACVRSHRSSHLRPRRRRITNRPAGCVFAERHLAKSCLRRRQRPRRIYRHPVRDRQTGPARQTDRCHPAGRGRSFRACGLWVRKRLYCHAGGRRPARWLAHARSGRAGGDVGTGKWQSFGAQRYCRGKGSNRITARKGPHRPNFICQTWSGQNLQSRCHLC